MLWHCSLGGRKGIRPVKKGNGGGGHWLVRMEWPPAGWSVCLSLLIFPSTIKSTSCLLALAHPGGPGKRAIKRLWCGGGDEVSVTWPSAWLVKMTIAIIRLTALYPGQPGWLEKQPPCLVVRYDSLFPLPLSGFSSVCLLFFLPLHNPFIFFAQSLSSFLETCISHCMWTCLLLQHHTSS